MKKTKTFNAGYKYLILLALCLVAINAMFGQYQMQPVANEIKQVFSLSDSQYSALFTASMTPAIFISLICGIIVDKFGGRWPIFISLCIGALGMWVRVFTGSYMILYICLFSVGFAATFGNSTNVKLFAGWFTPAQCSICIGIYMAVANIGSAIATSTTPLLPSLTVAYVLAAVLITVAAVFWLIFYRDWSDGDDQRDAANGEKIAASGESLLTTIKTVIKERDILLASIGDMCLYGGLMSINTFLGIILIDKGMTAESAGQVAAMVAVGMFLGNLVVPQVSARLGKVRSVITGFGFVGGVLLLLSAFLGQGMLLNIVLTVGCFLVGGCVPLIMAMPLRIKAVGPRRTATAGGILATFQLFGAVVIPTYVVANIAGGNYIRLVIISAVISLAGAVILRCISGQVEE